MADQEVRKALFVANLFLVLVAMFSPYAIGMEGYVGQDETCTLQNQLLTNANISITRTLNMGQFFYAMALAWAGENDKVLIIVTADYVGGSTIASSVYRSSDYGKTYKKLEIPKVIKKRNGLQRNPYDQKKVYLVGEGKFLYITENGGEDFNEVTIPFSMSGEFIFHSNPDYSHYLMVLDDSQVLHISYDNGKTWQESLSNVTKASWGVIPPADEKNKNSDTEKTIYVTVQDTEIQPIFRHLMFSQICTLKKSTNGGLSFKTLQENVVAFDRKGKFLYVSVIKNGNGPTGDRKMLISTDGGKSFMDAQIPTKEPVGFYSVMDIEDNIIFVHVHDVDDTGHGVLYTSSAQGVMYSESLQRHLFPNFGEIHDFYKVKSMKGVYLTSQMREDDSIHTMITYNRGATWQKIPRPEGVHCKDETKECYLQLHGMYSVKRGINAVPPVSEETAIGVIMAHGHVADALQITNPDVFVSSDGGYTWRLALKGPHVYQIGDHGGLLVAVSRATPNPKSIKFSLDEGRCWHEYNYTDKTLNFTGLLVQPSGKSTVVMVWGYDLNKRWEVHIIDFAEVIKRQCSEKDYEAWMIHSTHRADEGFQTQGCYLGIKETFLRLKKDAWCFNGYNHVKESSKTVCLCTREDYQCDYGYFRPEGSSACVKDPAFKGLEINICERGHTERLISEGYRKIPGDRCAGGFTPFSTLIDLDIECNGTRDDKTDANDASIGEDDQQVDGGVTIKYKTSSNGTKIYVFGYDDQDFNGAGKLSAISLTWLCLFGVFQYWM